MKFGKKLGALSIPLWKNNNIDYNELKRAIKSATSGSPPMLRRELRSAFLQQVEAVGLFVGLKRGELERKLVYSQNQLHQAMQQPEATRARTLAYLQQDITNLLQELRLLARFIVLQKVALRKLFKKFLKHYPGDGEDAAARKAKAKRLVDLVVRHLHETDGSLVRTDLTPLILELSFLTEYLRSPDVTTSAVQTLQSSLSSDAQFDIDCVGRYPQRILHAVDADNLAELRMALLMDPRFVQMDAEHRQHTLSRHASLSLLGSASRPALSRRQTQAPHRMLAIFLARGDAAPALVLLTSGQDHSVVILPVGGLRGHAYCHLPNSLIEQAVLDTSDHNATVAAFKEAGAYLGLTKMCLEWILDKGLVPCYKMVFTRQRWECRDPDVRLPMLITLDSGIYYTNTVTDLSTDDDGLTPFRFPILTVHHGSASATVASALLSLTRTRLANPLPASFTLYSYLRQHYTGEVDTGVNVATLRLQKINEDAVAFRNPVSTVLELYGATLEGTDDALELDPRAARRALRKKRLAREAAAPPPQRYWNEFDDGLEAEETGFYVGDDEYTQLLGKDQNWGPLANNDGRFNHLMEFLIGFLENITAKVESVVGRRLTISTLSNDSTPQLEQLLDESESPTSDGETRVADLEMMAAVDDYPVKHDQVLALIYFVCFFFGVLVDSVTVGALATLLRVGGHLSSGVVLMGVLFVSLMLAFMGNVLGVSLVMMRITNAPVWHSVVVWCGLTVTFSAAVYAVVEVLG